MNIPKELDPYVNDYKMEVFEIAWLTDEQLEMFKSDFKVVARFSLTKEGTLTMLRMTQQKSST